MTPRVCALAVFLLLSSSLSALAAESDQRLTIEGRINDQSVRLAFDTGFGAQFVVGHQTVEKLGLGIEIEPEGDPQSGLVHFGRTQPVRLELLGATFENVPLGLIDSPRFLDWDMDGIVGWQALLTNVISIRVADLTWTMLEAPPPEVAGWTHFPVMADKSVLVLDVSTLPGQPAGVLVDTGASDGVKLSPARWRAFRTSNRARPVTLDAYYTPGAGIVVSEEIWADEISIDGLTLRDVPVQEASIGDIAAAGEEYAATLGLTALARLNFVVDGANRVAFVETRSGPPPVYDHNRLGAVFVPPDLESPELVAHVAPDGPAARAGIRDGDRLLKVNEIDITGWQSNPAIRPGAQFWNQPAGTHYTLTLQRGKKKPFTVTVELQDILVGSSQAVARQ